MSGSQSNSNPNDLIGIAKRLMIALAIGAGLWLIWTQLLYPTYAVRYRLSVDVQTPQGSKTGSSIVEARFGFEPTLFGLIAGTKSSLVGEALFVDLDNGRNIVVTLTNRGSGRDGSKVPREKQALNGLTIPLAIFGIPSHDRQKTPKSILGAKSTGPKNIPVQRLPLIVTFTDLADPGSVVRIDPTNIGAFFGPGYSLAGAKIEIVDEPFLWSIERYLTWLEQLHKSGARLNGNTTSTVTSTDLADELGVGDFKVGGWK